MSSAKRLCVIVAVVAAAACSAPAPGEIIDVREMELAGQATVTAPSPDMGSKDALFDQNWVNLYRTDSVTNPVAITVEFTTPQTTGAARGLFTHTTWYQWTLEAADTVSDLDSQSGTYIKIFGPNQVPSGEISWEEWNDTPVTRTVYRFTVYRMYGDNHNHIRELELQTPEPIEEVLIGGDLVRINVIEVSPDDTELPVGFDQQYEAEASLSYGPDRYDVTTIASWNSDNPGVATVTSTGYVTAQGIGATAINADLGVVHGEAALSVRAARPADLDVPFIHRTPEYNRFKVSFTGDQHIMPGYETEKKWPDPGELVTYTAHVFNKGDATVADITYRWYFDDVLVEEGTIPSLAGLTQTTQSWSSEWPADTVQTVSIPPGAQTLHPKQLERAIGDHRIRFELDPDDEIAEGCEVNNVAEDYINAITFWLFIDETTYKYMNKHKSFLESYSAEDWCRMQLIGFERRIRMGGCPQRMRLDMVAIYPDGGLSAGGTHEPVGSETRQADGRWGFQIGEWPESKVIKFSKIVENPLTHEWGHQIGLIDIYQYDIATGNCLITHGGSPVAGTALMPTVSPWNVFYGNILVFHDGTTSVTPDSTPRALMADVSRRYIGAGSAAGMNRNLGLRRGFFGDYLGAIQQGDIVLRVRHHDGTPVPTCDLRVFQRDGTNAQVPDNPKFSGTTNAQGEWTFPATTLPGWEGGMAVNNPWSWKRDSTVYDCPASWGGNAPLIVELEFDGTTEYHFVEVDELNVAMGQGVVNDYTIELVTYASRMPNALPVISFNGASSSQATGAFTFQPDSLQVNRSATHTESMYVDFRADDTKFRAVKRMWFYVSDDPNIAYVNEPHDVPGDVDGNGVVDGLDLTAVITAWDTVPGDPLWNPAADLDGNGVVDGLDLTEVISNWTVASASASATDGSCPAKVKRGKGNVWRK